MPVKVSCKHVDEIDPRINVLAKGYSGISLGTLQQLIDAFNCEKKNLIFFKEIKLKSNLVITKVHKILVITNMLSTSRFCSSNPLFAITVNVNVVN